ncbi:MAG: hypothetical protein ACRC2T_06090, partial [Thermoguttaceae bacterium]
QRCFRRTRSITLVNILATPSDEAIFYDESCWVIPAELSLEDRDAMLFPEFLTASNRSRDAAAYLIHWLSTPSVLATQKRRLAELLREIDNVESPLEIAAKAILCETEKKR